MDAFVLARCFVCRCVLNLYAGYACGHGRGLVDMGERSLGGSDCVDGRWNLYIQQEEKIMEWIDIAVLIGAIVAVVGVIGYKIWQKKKGIRGCGCDCSCCNGCPRSAK